MCETHIMICIVFEISLNSDSLNPLAKLTGCIDSFAYTLLGVASLGKKYKGFEGRFTLEICEKNSLHYTHI